MKYSPVKNQWAGFNLSMSSKVNVIMQSSIYDVFLYAFHTHFDHGIHHVGATTDTDKVTW